MLISCAGGNPGPGLRLLPLRRRGRSLSCILAWACTRPWATAARKQKSLDPTPPPLSLRCACVIPARAGTQTLCCVSGAGVPSGVRVERVAAAVGACRPERVRE